MRGPAAVALVATIAATGALATGAAAAKRGLGRHWGGATSQDDPLVLTLRRGSRALGEGFVFVEGKCADGKQLAYYGKLTFARSPASFVPDGGSRMKGARLSRTGRFRATGSGSAAFGSARGSIAWKLSGRLARGAGAGTLRGDFTIFDEDGRLLTACSTGALVWTTRSARGRVYAGATGEDQPVVVAVERDGSRVSELRFGWGAPCDPGPGGWLMGDRLTGFSLSSGRFGDAFQIPIQFPDGTRRTLDYDVHGQLGRAWGSGTVAVKVTDYAATGEPAQTCDSGPQLWSARSG
jgi:hypothetical protein